MAVNNKPDVADRIMESVAKILGIPKCHVKLQDRLLHDLRIYGDDAEDLVLMIADSFGLDASEFPFQEYFPSEVSAFWLLPNVLKQRMLSKIKAVTVADLVDSVALGTWPRSQ